MTPLIHELIAAAVKAAAVLAMAGGLTLALRRASAAARHLVWTLAVTVALLLPAASVLLPAWRVGVLPSTVSGTTIAAQPDGPRAYIRNADDDAPSPPANVTPVPRRVAPLSLPPVTPPLTIIAQPAARSHRPTASALILIVWIAGFVAVAIMGVVGVAAAHRLGRRMPVVSAGPLLEATDALRRELGIARRVTLHVGGTTPLTWGILYPRLLLPTPAAGWPPDRLRAVLLHELSHVRRHDCATQWLAHLCCCVHWFDPLAWLAAARMRSEREQACDDAVLCRGADPASYAELLLAVAVGGHVPAGAVAMARRSGLRDRVRSILNRTASRRPVGRRWAGVAAAVATLLLLPLAAVRFATRPVVAQVAPSAVTDPSPRPKTHRASVATTRSDSPRAVGDASEPPRLRFLAWQGGDRPDPKHPVIPWTPDGGPVTGEDARLFGAVPHTGLNESNTEHPPLDVLYLWLSHPEFDAASTVAVEVLDGDGRSLQGPPADVCSQVAAPDAARGNVGWASVGLGVGTAGGRPKVAAVRLTYTGGRWTVGGAPIPADYSGMMSLGKRIQWSANGQDRYGRAYVAIARSGPRDVECGFLAHTRDGRDVPCDVRSAGGNDDVSVERFAAEVPLAEVVSFQPRTRPVRTVTFPVVSLVAGVAPPTRPPSSRPAPARIGPGPVEQLSTALERDILQRSKPDLRRATVARVRTMLAGDDPVAQAAALTAVWHTGEVPYDRAGMAPVVVRLLASPSAAVRRAALGAVYAVHPDPVTARPAVERLADDPDPSVRSQVVGGLLGLRTYDPAKPAEPMGEPALKLLGDVDRDVVIDTAQRLWGIEVTPAVERKVIELSRWPADGPVPEAKSIPYWMMYFVLSTREPTVSQPVAERLAELAADPRLDENWHQRTIWGLGNHTASPEARNVIVKALIAEVDGSLNDRDRYWAVLGLGRIGTPAALAKVREVAEGEASEQLKQLARRYVPAARR